MKNWINKNIDYYLKHPWQHWLSLIISGNMIFLGYDSGGFWRTLILIFVGILLLLLTLYVSFRATQIKKEESVNQ